VTGYDVMLRSSLYQQGSDMQIGSFMKNGITYNLHKDNYDIVLTDENNKEILRYPTQEIFDHFEGKDVTNKAITTKEATFTKENVKASIQLVKESVSITQYEGGKDKSAEFYLFVRIK
jgi:hypothetical protein